MGFFVNLSKHLTLMFCIFPLLALRERVKKWEWGNMILPIWDEKRDSERERSHGLKRKKWEVGRLTADLIEREKEMSRVNLTRPVKKPYKVSVIWEMLDRVSPTRVPFKQAQSGFNLNPNPTMGPIRISPNQNTTSPITFWPPNFPKLHFGPKTFPKSHFGPQTFLDYILAPNFLKLQRNPRTFQKSQRDP